MVTHQFRGGHGCPLGREGFTSEILDTSHSHKGSNALGYLRRGPQDFLLGTWILQVVVVYSGLQPEKEVRTWEEEAEVKVVAVVVA